MNMGTDFHQTPQFAHDRLDGYYADADTYRAVGYERYHSNARRFSEWFGNLLLAWGRRVRERQGDVVVRIAVRPRRSGHEHAA